MTQKHLLQFIKKKYNENSNEIVTITHDKRQLTLHDVFNELNLTANDLSIDSLDMFANNTFQRFDMFNLKYNPAGQSLLREIFLKVDNYMDGKYLAEITSELIADLQETKYTLVEWRLSIYGKKVTEWKTLSHWFYRYRLAHSNVRWMIQIPRLYAIYKHAHAINSFAELLFNIFNPLFEVSINPSSDIELHCFLQTIVAFDSVDDESRPEPDLTEKLPSPDKWTFETNPPYAYYMYYMHVNILMLNKVRADRGLNTFQFRPHCGEAFK